MNEGFLYGTREVMVVGIRECRTRSAVHAHGSYAGGYRRVWGVVSPVIGGGASEAVERQMSANANRASSSGMKCGSVGFWLCGRLSGSNAALGVVELRRSSLKRGF